MLTFGPGFSERNQASRMGRGPCRSPFANPGDYGMRELQLCLDFACCGCEGNVNVTVQCKGKGLAAGPCTVAAVKVPCPICGNVNQVCFHPTGDVVAVESAEAFHRLLVPSLN